MEENSENQENSGCLELKRKRGRPRKLFSIDNFENMTSIERCNKKDEYLRSFVSTEDRKRIAEAKFLTISKMFKVIENSNGNFTLIASRLGCTRRTIHNYYNSIDIFRVLVDNEREIILDVAEDALSVMVKDDKHNDHFNSVKFLLQNRGASRGYHNPHNNLTVATKIVNTSGNADQDNDNIIKIIENDDEGDL